MMSVWQNQHAVNARDGDVVATSDQASPPPLGGATQPAGGIATEVADFTMAAPHAQCVVAPTWDAAASAMPVQKMSWHDTDSGLTLMIAFT